MLVDSDQAPGQQEAFRNVDKEDLILCNTLKRSGYLQHAICQKPRVSSHINEF